MSATWTPRDLDAVTLAFPASVMDLMPPYSEIPAEFTRETNPYVRFVSNWFFSGADATRLKERAGIDRRKALRHLKAIMGSWEPKHEHKEAGVAYLLSLWFEISAATPGESR